MRILRVAGVRATSRRVIGLLAAGVFMHVALHPMLDPDCLGQHAEHGTSAVETGPTAHGGTATSGVSHHDAAEGPEGSDAPNHATCICDYSGQAEQPQLAVGSTAVDPYAALEFVPDVRMTSPTPFAHPLANGPPSAS